MTDTPSLGLPLLAPAQAQKHVTVNEALVRLDGLAQLRLQSCTVTAPPDPATEGACYGVPDGASGGWDGYAGAVAIASNGGWVFVQPSDGWSAWVVDASSRALFSGGLWRNDVVARAANGAGSLMSVVEAEHVVQAGGVQEIALDIPANAMVFACSARVAEDLSGSLASWSLGLPGEDAKFGSGMGLLAGSYCTGILSQPTTYYSGVRPIASPVGGDFGGGRLKLALHLFRVDLPA